MKIKQTNLWLVQKQFFFSVKKVNNIFIPNYLDIYWKSEFCNFAGLITSTENAQKKFDAIFVISYQLHFEKFFIKFHWDGQKLKYILTSRSLANPLEWLNGRFSMKFWKVGFSEKFGFTNYKLRKTTKDIDRRTISSIMNYPK